MANFSVEWLSRSYYEEEMSVHAEETPRGPTSPSNSFGDTSGSESEVGDDSEGEAGQQRRMRTKFTSEQVSGLESTFSRHRYLGAVQRRGVAERLSLSETQVKTWFQNRRMKLKREVQDLRPDLIPVPAALLFQHHLLGGQLPAGSGFYAQLRPLHSAALPAALHQQRPLLMPARFY